MLDTDARVSVGMESVSMHMHHLFTIGYKSKACKIKQQTDFLAAKMKASPEIFKKSTVTKIQETTEAKVLNRNDCFVSCTEQRKQKATGTVQIVPMYSIYKEAYLHCDTLSCT